MQLFIENSVINSTNTHSKSTYSLTDILAHDSNVSYSQISPNTRPLPNDVLAAPIQGLPIQAPPIIKDLQSNTSVAQNPLYTVQMTDPQLSILLALANYISTNWTVATLATLRIMSDVQTLLLQTMSTQYTNGLITSQYYSFCGPPENSLNSNGNYNNTLRASARYILVQDTVPTTLKFRLFSK